MKSAVRFFVILILSFNGLVTYAQSNHSMNVNGDDLSCDRYNGEDYFYAELNGQYVIENTKFSHHFSRFLFSDSCAQVDDLKGRTHKVDVKIKAQPYNATICERGGSWYCQQYGCYSYRVEYVDILFPNGLKLSSEVHTPLDEAVKLHNGQCAY